MADDSEIMCYVARKPCGCLIAATVDVPETQEEVAEEIGNWIIAGFTVERVTVEYARENLNFNCQHETVN